MEVHQHGHHAGKKNWKSYIWEFLMLFFAVFCGFLAEWRLEVMIENHREQEYIHSIVEDINADVKQTDNLVVNVQSRIDLIDSLLQEITSAKIEENSNNANKLWLSTIGFPDFVQNDRTIQQLKSSGSLRIIRNKKVSDQIMEYDQTVRLLYITQNNMNTIASNNTLYGQFFDLIKIKNQSSKTIPLTENGKKLLNEAYSNRFFWKINLVGLKQRLIILNQKGKEVTEIIKKEYRLN
jgi:hypothetical protein